MFRIFYGEKPFIFFVMVFPATDSNTKAFIRPPIYLAFEPPSRPPTNEPILCKLGASDPCSFNTLQG